MRSFFTSLLLSALFCALLFAVALELGLPPTVDRMNIGIGALFGILVGALGLAAANRD